LNKSENELDIEKNSRKKGKQAKLNACRRPQRQGHKSNNESITSETHLRNLISEHVAIIVMGRHTESTLCPADNLHRSSIRYQMLKFAIWNKT